MFTVTYDFDVPIEINGVLCGSFQGEAILEEEGTDFYVARIVLHGERVTRRPGCVIPDRADASVRLPGPVGFQSFERELSERIAQAIYSSEHAREYFEEQLAMECAA